MSDERDNKAGRFANDEAEQDAVEAHVKTKMNDEAESADDDVEAHVKHGKDS